MGNTEKFTPEQVAQAIADTHGLLTLAAKKLRCNHETIRNYIKRYPELQQVVEAARGDLVDIAEEKLLEAVKSGDFRAVAFTLKTLGRDRGWVEKTDVNLSGDVTVRLPTVFLPARLDDDDELTVDRLTELLEIAQRQGGSIPYTPPYSPQTKQATGNPYQEYQQPPVMDYPAPARIPAPQPIIDHTPPPPQKTPLLWRPPALVKESE